MDTHRLPRALKSTGKSANFTAEEIADAVDVAQADGEWVTRNWVAGAVSACPHRRRNLQRVRVR